MFVCLEKSTEKRKTSAREVDEAAICSVTMSYAKLFAGLSTMNFDHILFSYALHI